VEARKSFAVIALAGVCALGGCAGSGRGTAAPDVLHDDAVTVGSFDFPESVLLGEIYGRALQAKGIDVHMASGVGPRELVEPALAAGLVEFVPEYAGTAVEFLGRGDRHPSDDLAATRAALAGVLDRSPVVPLASAPAQDANAVVVTRDVADRYHLRSISDLARSAPQLTFGGPPGCPERPFCLGGLSTTYGLHFQRFMPLDVGGPLTRAALAGGHIDAALLFTTDPAIGRDGLVMLTDDRRLQPVENVTPVVRREVVQRWGHRFTATVDAVSARLTTPTLRALNAAVAEGQPAGRVASRWLREEGLA